MKTRKLVLVLAAAGTAGIGGYALYQLGVEHATQAQHSAAGSVAPMRGAAQKAGDVDPITGKTVLYWHDPMVPGQKFDRPGKSPFMDMPLTPVYAGDGGDENTVAISARVQQNLGVRTAEAREGTLAQTIEAGGAIAYNERDVALVQARSGGFVERLFVRAPLDAVRRGQPLAELYVPDWVSAQEEYLSARRITARSGAESLAALVDGARQRMRLAGMSEEQIRAVEADGKVRPSFTITSPIDGVVGELTAREGMTVMAGAPLFRLNGLSTVWINAEVPEGAASQLRPGMAAEARTPALPGVVFTGRVGAILPEVNPVTRTIKARIEVANPGAQLVPGMFATVTLSPATRASVVLVPSEAVIQTGRRSVVIVADGKGGFSPVDVDVGIDSGGRTEIRKGLRAGQQVVVSGQFLIDSEANLKAATARMNQAPPAAPSGAREPGKAGVKP